MEKDPGVAWLAIWLTIGGILLASYQPLAMLISTYTGWKKELIQNAIISAGTIFVLLPLLLATLRVLKKLPRFLESIYQRLVWSAKVLISPITWLLSHVRKLVGTWIKSFFAWTAQNWTKLTRKLTTALLRSVGVDPDNLRRSMAETHETVEQLTHRVSALEETPIMDEVCLKILSILHKEKHCDSLELRRKNDLPIDGLSDHELARRLGLGADEVFKIHGPLRKLGALNMIQGVWKGDSVTWWEASQGSTVLLYHRYIK